MGSDWRLLPQLESNTHSTQHTRKRHGSRDVGPLSFDGGYRPHGCVARGLHGKALTFVARNDLYYRGTDACIGSNHDGYAT